MGPIAIVLLKLEEIVYIVNNILAVPVRYGLNLLTSMNIKGSAKKVNIGLAACASVDMTRVQG